MTYSLQLLRLMARVEELRVYGQALGLSVDDIAGVLNKYGRVCSERGIAWDDGVVKQRLLDFALVLR